VKEKRGPTDFDKLKNFVISNFPNEKASEETRKTFLEKCAVTNRVPTFTILCMLLAMESLMVFIYLIVTYFLKWARFYPQYIYLYLSMIFICLYFFIRFRSTGNSARKLMRLELIMLSIIGVWSAVFSACDVINGFSSYLFIQLMMIHSLLFKVEPVKHCIINILSFSVYAILILVSHLNLTITFAELVNPFFMMAAACIVLLLNFQTKFKVYIDQELINEQNKKLEFYANNDYLTKTPNRKSIIEYLDGMLLSHNKCLACIMIDIDNFKQYNDTYGHIMGDTCLTDIAAAMEGYVLSRDGKVGRYGGEEFLIVFSELEENDVESLAEGLIRIVNAQNIEFSASPVSNAVTISGGIYLKRKTESMDHKTLIALADRELYRAKKEGKNRISIYRKDFVCTVSPMLSVPEDS